MKAVILAGGRGTRIAEESHLRPKPMVEIGGKPILWHILKYYSHFGVNDFILCLGYKSHVVKDYFANYCLYGSDVSVDLTTKELHYHHSRAEPWKVTLVDTGETTSTGGRLRRVRQYLDGETAFCLTYGDGLSDVDLDGELRFHRRHGMMATMTVVRPPARFGSSLVEGDRVKAFVEKPQAGEGFINGGFFVLSPRVIDFIDGDATPLESETLQTLARMGELAAWRHTGFWHPMDTLRDREMLESYWGRPDCPWRVWERSSALCDF